MKLVSAVGLAIAGVAISCSGRQMGSQKARLEEPNQETAKSREQSVSTGLGGTVKPTDDPPKKQTQEAEERAPMPAAPEWSVEVSWRWACPGPPTRADSGPVYILQDLSDLYPQFYSDYMDRYGEWGADAPKLDKSAGREVVCATLEEGARSVLENVRNGVFPRRATSGCSPSDRTRVSFDRFSYELLKLPKGCYAAVRTARMPGNPGGAHEIRARVQDGFVVATVTSKAFRCPQDREDPCRESERDDGSLAMTCFDDTTECVDAGFDTEVVVTNVHTGEAFRSGPFERRPIPTVVLVDGHAEIRSAECVQRASLP